MKDLEGKIIMLVGLTSTGKDTVASYIEDEYGVHREVSHTTRPMREGETEGVEYYFTNKEHFLDMVKKGEIFEYRTYDTLVNNEKDTWYYGTVRSEIKDDILNVTVLDDEGCRQMVKEFGRERCIGILVNAHPDTMRKLSMERGNHCDIEFDRRLKVDSPKFNAEFLNECVDYNLFNRGKGLGELFLEVDMVLEEIENE